jgi:trans-aconitate methyltransferase
MNFTQISNEYEEKSIVQNDASVYLLNLLDIKENENVLDVGCGTGNITSRINNITNAKVTGIDPSTGMINEAQKKYSNVIFECKDAKNLNDKNQFDVIFCNSTFQWFNKNTENIIENFYNILKSNGRIGIQAPATKIYCPNFVKGIEAIKTDNRTKDIFSHYNNPFLFLDSSNEYKELFEKSGFKVKYSEIKSISSKYSPDETFNIFSSGAIIGYLNEDFYSVKLTQKYIDDFKDIIKDEICKQAKNNLVDLTFNRIYLLAYK